MFLETTFEDRAKSWATFRESVKTTTYPIQTIIHAYNQISLSSITCDPWDQNTWPNAWELLDRNQYCQFTVLLGIGYTVSLAGIYSSSNLFIHSIENKNNHKFLLDLQNILVGHAQSEIIIIDRWPENIKIIKTLPIPNVH